jgi:hypothetical protein
MIHKRQIELPLLLAILLLAGWLRFGWVGVNSFAGDEARISLDALRVTRGGEFVFIAQQSSTGIPFLPASVWMFAPPYLLTPDPLGATLYVSLLSWLTVVGVWAMARQWGMWAGLSAALFMAASPYAVFYGRSIWQPNLLPFLGLAWAWTAWRVLKRDDKPLNPSPISLTRERRGWGEDLTLIAHIFLAGFIWQVHFAGAALALGTAILFVYGRWWRNWGAVLIGGFLAALCTLPYVYYLVTQAPQVLAQFGQVGGGDATIDLSGARNLLHIALGYDWGYLALGEFDTFSRGAVTVVMAAVLVAIGAWCVVRGAKGRIQVGAQYTAPLHPTHVNEADKARLVSTQHALLVLIWLLASPLFFLRHTTPVLPHYQLIALPALALLVGAATTLVDKRAWRWGISGLTLALAVVWTTQIAASLDRAAIDRPPQSALSSILRESRDAALALPHDRPAIFYTHGDDPAISGEVAVFRVLLWEHPDLRIFDGTSTLILPNTPSAQMSTLAAFQAWEELVDLGLASDVREYPRRPPGEAFVMGMLQPADLGRGNPTGRPYDNDTTLLDIGTRRVGDRLRISSLWAADDAPMGATQAFHHLYRLGDADDALPALEDLPPQSELGTPDYGADVSMGMLHWRAGDHAVVMADFIDLPPGVYRLIIGQYTLPDGARIPLLEGGDGVSWVFVWDDP